MSHDQYKPWLQNLTITAQVWGCMYTLDFCVDGQMIDNDKSSDAAGL